LWLADIQSWAGDQLARVALSVMVFDRTGSALTTAAVYALTFLPEIIAGALLAGLADRYSRRTVMIVCDILRAGLVGAMAIPGVPIAVICLLLVIAILVGRPFASAENALLPDILSHERFVVANGLRMMTEQFAQLGGFAFGGLAITLVGSRGGLAIDAVTFLISAAMITIFVKPRPAPSPGEDQSSTMRSSTMAAVRLLAREPALRVLISLGWLAAFYVAPEGLAPAYAASIGAGPTAVGLLLAAIAAGCVIGTYILVRIVPQYRQQSLIGPLAISTGLPLIACAFHPGLAVSLVLWALSGALSAFQVLTAAAFIRAIPPHRRGQTIGLASSGLLAIQGVGILVFGVVADAIGAAGAIAIAAAVGSAVAVPLAIVWMRQPVEPILRYAPRHGGRRTSGTGGTTAPGLAKHREFSQKP
jgi:MFS family permease